MANDVVPDTVPGHRPPQPPRRRRLPRQWVGLTVLVLAIAAATVIVPPLITPHHHQAAAPPAAAPSESQTTPPAASESQTTPPAASPATTTTAPSSPPPSSAPAAKFIAITLEAEDPDATLTGGAAPTACGACRGGGRVRYICFKCQVTLHSTVPVAGKRTVTVYYESDGDRTVKVKINDAAPRIFETLGVGWDTPRSFHFTADVPAGPLRVTLYNDDTPAPDLDEVVIS